MLNIKNIIKIMAVAALIMVADPELAFAQGACLGKSGLFEILRCKAATTLNDLRPIVYALGGFGIIAFSFAAIFGKINFGHLASIGIGLFLVAVMGGFISYFVSGYGVNLSFKDYLPNTYEYINGTSDIGGGCMLNASGSCDESGLGAKGETPSTGGTVPENPNPSGSEGSKNAEEGNKETEEKNDDAAKELEKEIENNQQQQQNPETPYQYPTA